MIPSIDDRLDSMARALAEVILPALPADRSLAIEQASLVLAHIGILRDHIDAAARFERREADAMLALARDLCDGAAGGERTMAAAAALRTAIDAASVDTPADARATTCRIGEAVEALIDASGVDGRADFKARSFDSVVAAGQVSAARDRAWNQAAGFEAADTQHAPADW
ncbi:hypothetical protein [Sphingomonas profundi]|uniref:hypothetical protein n=1 Tax=Alterirhizorhabdus profundi TaxID=2681549 RepID=UPI0012E80DCC|nr:hypothetical protein [Sphingomonas profundi]